MTLIPPKSRRTIARDRRRKFARDRAHALRLARETVSRLGLALRLSDNVLKLDAKNERQPDGAFAASPLLLFKRCRTYLFRRLERCRPEALARIILTSAGHDPKSPEPSIYAVRGEISLMGGGREALIEIAAAEIVARAWTMLLQHVNQTTL